VTRHSVDDRSYIDRRVEAVDAAALEGPVRSLLRDPAAHVTEWSHEPIAYDFLNPSSGGVYRFTGSASGADWSLVLKVSRSTESLDDASPLPSGLAEIRAEAVRWDRELLAYESGFLAGLQGGFVAAECHGGARYDDDTAWLWLEDLGDSATGPWPLERWASVGSELGRFNGGYLAAGDVPEHGWLGRNWLRIWVTRLTPFHFGVPLEGAVWDERLAREAYPAALRDRLGAVWSDRERRLRAVEALPRTCSHLDAHRRNIFLRGDQVVAIDWGLVGLAAPGEEIASTLVGTVASGEVPLEQAPDLAAILYESYVDGLRDAGWRGRERDVRLAFTTAAALRAFSVLGLHAADDAQALARSAALARFLVDLD
jgi:hypothetical protein